MLDSRSLHIIECLHIFYGRVAEWPNAAVLRTVDLKGSGGSNPSSSAFATNSNLWFCRPEGPRFECCCEQYSKVFLESSCCFQCTAHLEILPYRSFQVIFLKLKLNSWYFVEVFHANYLNDVLSIL